jgi:hypothetical protein
MGSIPTSGNGDPGRSLNAPLVGSISKPQSLSGKPVARYASGREAIASTSVGQQSMTKGEPGTESRAPLGSIRNP